MPIPLLVLGVAAAGAWAALRASSSHTDTPILGDAIGVAPTDDVGVDVITVEAPIVPEYPAQPSTMTWPVRAAGVNGPGGPVGVITQEYKPGVHLGVDIAIPGHYRDATAVVCAVADGMVTKAYHYARGWAVLLDHGDWASSYLHMSSLYAGVSVGEQVSAGSALGPMGADPTDPEGVVHLHLQIAPGGQTVDPAPWLVGAT